MSASTQIKIAYGKNVGGLLDAPQRFDQIENTTDRMNAGVVFGAVMAYYQDTPKSILLLEVDEFIKNHPTPHWRLCVYGLDAQPTRDDIYQMTRDMDPVKPLSITFEPKRQSHTLFRGDFLTHALCIAMPSAMAPAVPLTRAPDIVEAISSHNVDSWPTMRRATPASIETKRAGITSTMLRRKTPMCEKRTREDRLTKARQRFENRSRLETWADYIAGVKWEHVAREIETMETEEQFEGDADDLR